MRRHCFWNLWIGYDGGGLLWKCLLELFSPLFCVYLMMCKFVFWAAIADLSLTYQVHRSKVNCGSQSVLLQNVCGWAAQQGLSTLLCMVGERPGSWPKIYLVVHAQWSLQHSLDSCRSPDPCHFHSLVLWAFAIRNPLLFLLPVLLLAAVNKANGDLVHLTSP